MHQKTSVATPLILILTIASLPVTAQVNVFTQHNDNARTGLNTNETVLTPANVNMSGFGQIFYQPVDGTVYAQPLYVSNLVITNKGRHNVVFVATMHDSVYAFDADSNSGSNAPPLWHTSFINPAAGVTVPQAADAAAGSGDCQTFLGDVGIIGTPVVDPTNLTLYVLARTKEPAPPPGTTFVQVQRLHALDITTGTERPNSPVEVTATVPGTASGGSTVSFDPVREVQRSGLLLAGGVVYICWTSYCDNQPYHGWIIGYDAQTLQQVAVFNATPNSRQAGIWMGGAGAAEAPDGTIYCITGNGAFDTTVNPQDFGDSFLKLTPHGTNLVLTDYFTPYNQANLDQTDNDLGSGGAMVLPDETGSTLHPHLVVGGGKEGTVYLVDRDNMGHFNPAGNTQIVQTISLTGVSSSDIVFGLPAYFKNRIYYQPNTAPLKAFAISNAVINPTPFSQATDNPIPFRGSTPSISANGTTNGIVWELLIAAAGTTSLHAYNAENLAQKTYDSYAASLAGAPDLLGFVKFVVPTIANGKVYVGTTTNLAVLGLRSIIWSFTQSSGTVRVVFSGPTDRTNILQASPDLVNWTDLGPGSATGTGTFSYTETLAASTPTRFYRIKPE